MVLLTTAISLNTTDILKLAEFHERLTTCFSASPARDKHVKMYFSEKCLCVLTAACSILQFSR